VAELISPDERRWFEDLGHYVPGRLLEVYRTYERGGQMIAMCSVHWRHGRPLGSSRERDIKWAALETERLHARRRGGDRPRRFRELTGDELEGARRWALQRYAPAEEGGR